MLYTTTIKQFLQLRFQSFKLLPIERIQFLFRRISTTIFQINIVIKVRIIAIIRESWLFKYFRVRLLQLLQDRVCQINIAMLIPFTMTTMCCTMRKIALLLVITMLLLQCTHKYFFVLSLLNSTHKWLQIAHLKQVLACTQVNLVIASTRYIIRHLRRTLSSFALTSTVLRSILS